VTAVGEFVVELAAEGRQAADHGRQYGQPDGEDDPPVAEGAAAEPVEQSGHQPASLAGRAGMSERPAAATATPAPSAPAATDTMVAKIICLARRSASPASCCIIRSSLGS
jgi:hypothetical protein